MKVMENSSERDEIRAAFDWLVGIIGGRQWARRKSVVEKHVNTVLKPKSKLVPLYSESARVLYPEDQFAWYLYLTESYLSHPENYDFAQGSRVIPIMKSIGRWIHLVEDIEGLRKRMSKMANEGKKEADSGLFEALVALAYARNGHCTVKFIKEYSERKTCDLSIATNETTWMVECKRLSKSSEYSITERMKWLKMWQYLNNYFVRSRHSVVLDIHFHVELMRLDDDFIAHNVIPKLKLVGSAGIIVDNEVWTVSVEPTDYGRIRKVLDHTYVKINSAILNDIIAGPFESGRGFTCVIEAKNSHLYPNYLEDISFAAGAIWSCDAEEAIQKKARDIRKHLAEAINQLPSGSPAIIHIGLEAQDGNIVEKERFFRILKTLIQFDPYGKDLHWVYIHIFEPRVPIDKNWEFFETVYPFSKPERWESPLVEHYLVELGDLESMEPIYFGSD
jgi:hypothetical protein